MVAGGIAFVGFGLHEAAQHRPPPTAASSPAAETEKPKETATPEEPIIKARNFLTAENFQKIETGMTYDQVKAIIGPANEESASASTGQGTEFATSMVMLTWKGSWGASGNVTFQDGHVVAKAQLGLPHEK